LSEGEAEGQVEEFRRTNIIRSPPNLDFGLISQTNKPTNIIRSPPNLDFGLISQMNRPTNIIRSPPNLDFGLISQTNGPKSALIFDFLNHGEGIGYIG
jgi:hypothetical protein